MLFKAVVQEFYLSKYVTTDSSIVTPVEKNVVMDKFQMSAYRICFFCLHWQILLAQSPYSK